VCVSKILDGGFGSGKRSGLSIEVVEQLEAAVVRTERPHLPHSSRSAAEDLRHGSVRRHLSSRYALAELRGHGHGCMGTLHEQLQAAPMSTGTEAHASDEVASAPLNTAMKVMANLIESLLESRGWALGLLGLRRLEVCSLHGCAVFLILLRFFARL
jgi:hypothetical protein